MLSLPETQELIARVETRSASNLPKVELDSGLLLIPSGSIEDVMTDIKEVIEAIGIIPEDTYSIYASRGSNHFLYVFHGTLDLERDMRFYCSQNRDDVARLHPMRNGKGYSYVAGGNTPLELDVRTNVFLKAYKKNIEKIIGCPADPDA